MYASMNGWLVSSSVMVFGGIRLRLGSKQLVGQVAQRLVHRLVDARVGHDLAEVLDQVDARSGPAADAGERPARDGACRVQRSERTVGQARQAAERRTGPAPVDVDARGSPRAAGASRAVRP